MKFVYDVVSTNSIKKFGTYSNLDKARKIAKESNNIKVSPRLTNYWEYLIRKVIK